MAIETQDDVDATRSRPWLARIAWGAGGLLIGALLAADPFGILPFDSWRRSGAAREALAPEGQL